MTFVVKTVAMRLQEWLTRWLTKSPAVLVTFGLGVALLGGGVAVFRGGHPDPGMATAGVGIAAVGLGFALLGDVWLGVSVAGVAVVLLAGALDSLVPGDLGDAFGLAMMGAGVGVVLGGAISRTSQVWVGITTLTGGVVTGAGAFVLVLRGNGLGVVGFVLPVKTAAETMSEMSSARSDFGPLLKLNASLIASIATRPRLREPSSARVHSAP